MDDPGRREILSCLDPTPTTHRTTPHQPNVRTQRAITPGTKRPPLRMLIHVCRSSPKKSTPGEALAPGPVLLPVLPVAELQRRLQEFHVRISHGLFEREYPPKSFLYIDEPDEPKVGGFGFVDAVPSPTPSQLGVQGMKQLMTLGTLLATPRVLSGGDDPADLSAPSPFEIKGPGMRDTLGRKLGSEAGKALSKKAGLLGGATPRVSSPLVGGGGGKERQGERGRFTAMTPKRVDMLTPAARRLLDRTRGGGLGGVSGDGGRGGLLGGLTPVSDSNYGRRGGKQLDLRKVGWDSPRAPR